MDTAGHFIINVKKLTDIGKRAADERRRRSGVKALFGVDSHPPAQTRPVRQKTKG